MTPTKLITALIAAGVVWVVPTTLVAADRPPGPPSATQTASYGHSKTSPEIVQGPPGIACYINIADAHESGHNPGNVNVVSTVSCTSPVSQIYMNTYLWYSVTGSGWNIVAVGTTNVYNTSYTTGQANVACTSGFYYGEANETTWYPPGYSPSPQSSTVWSTHTFATSC
jgi:hypothetical protein